jgi:hypothetical protein
LENKQRFISQINHGDFTMREASDIDEATLTYSEIKAITAANPKIKRKMEIELEVSRLKTLQGSHIQNQYHYQNRIAGIPKELEKINQNIVCLNSDIVRQDENKDVPVRIGNQSFEERKPAGEKLIAIVKSQKFTNQKIGSIMGFDIVPCEFDAFYKIYSVNLVGANTYNVNISESETGTIQRLENTICALEENLDKATKKKTALEQEYSVAQAEVDKPFEHHEQLIVLSDELAAIDIELDLGKDETPIVLESESDDSSARGLVPVQKSYEEEAVAC